MMSTSRKHESFETGIDGHESVSVSKSSCGLAEILLEKQMIRRYRASEKSASIQEPEA